MVVSPLMIKLILNILGVALIGIIVASCLLTIFAVIIYFVMVHDCGYNNEDDCFPSDIGLDEANFENMTKIHREQVCYVVSKFLCFHI